MQDYVWKDLVFHTAPPWLSHQIARYKTALEKPYQEALRRSAEDHKKAEDQRLAEHSTKLPYRSMAQSDISNTALGSPANRYSKEMYIDHELKTVTYYEFQKNGRTYFSVKCIDGQVVEVKQYTKAEMEQTPTRRPQPTEDDDPYGSGIFRRGRSGLADHHNGPGRPLQLIFPQRLHGAPQDSDPLFRLAQLLPGGGGFHGEELPSHLHIGQAQLRQHIEPGHSPAHGKIILLPPAGRFLLGPGRDALRSDPQLRQRLLQPAHPLAQGVQQRQLHFRAPHL